MNYAEKLSGLSPPARAHAFGPAPLIATAAPWLVALLLAAIGCSREHYRRTADQDVYQAVGQKTCDPFWPLDGYTIQPSPESRFYDVANPNYPPMPPDDPAAHKLMHCINGMCGDGCWHCNGSTPFVENPAWMSYLPFNQRGEVILDLEGSVRLALLHAPDYQRELED